MSNALHNTLHAFSETWLGVPGWAWLLIVIIVLVVVILPTRAGR